MCYRRRNEPAPSDTRWGGSSLSRPFNNNTGRKHRGCRVRVLATLGVAVAAFLAYDLVLLWTRLYRAVLAPDSSAGSFETAIGRLRALPIDRRRDVLVLGDSRIFSGLDSGRAGASGGLRFLDGSVPGTTPRCWLYFLRAVDPSADRFRAVVVPVHTYYDEARA